MAEGRNATLQRLDAKLAEDQAVLDAVLAKAAGNTPEEAPGGLDETPQGTPAPPAGGNTSDEAPEEARGTQESDTRDGPAEPRPAEPAEEPGVSVFEALEEGSPVDEGERLGNEKPKPEREPFEAQFRVLQGKYNAETEKLRTQMEQLEAQNAVLRDERNALLAESTGPLSADRLRDTYKLTDEQIEVLSPETAAVVHQMVQSSVDAVQRQHAEQLAGLRGEYEREVTAQADTSFRARVAETYPELNNSKPLVEFIRRDPARFRNFQAAVRNHNEAAIGDAVRLFRAETKTPSKPSLASQQMGKGAGTPPKTSKKPITLDDVKAMESAYISKRGSMTDEQRRDASRQIEAARKSFLDSIG